MDITPQDSTTQPISDDQELAKALAGVLPDEPVAVPDPNSLSGMQFEEVPIATPAEPPVDPAQSPYPAAPQSPYPTPVPAPAFPVQEAPVVPDETPVIPSFDTPAAPVFDTPVASPNNNGLESVKQDAIQELRPLIDHIDLPAEEKFDTYLLLIRSTDDASLIAPAHVAAQGIADEKRKAEALLDIIKEIDYLSKKDQAAL
jgi:hypothetical protein